MKKNKNKCPHCNTKAKLVLKQRNFAKDPNTIEYHYNCKNCNNTFVKFVVDNLYDSINLGEVIEEQINEIYYDIK